jgi:hypothetical protein
MFYYIDSNGQVGAGVTIYFSPDTGAVGTYGDILTLPIDNIAPIGMVFQNRHYRVLGQVKLRGTFVNTYIQ